MIASLVRESRAAERRVLLLPEDARPLAGVCELRAETGAGFGLGVTDQDYADIGATVVGRSEAWQADIVLKLKAPSVAELGRMRPGAAIAALFHAEGTPDVVRALLDGGMDAYSFEYFQDGDCFPLMAATGEIAGKMAIIYAAYHLQSHLGGSGIALPALSHASRARVAIIGYGNAGKAAAEVARALGAEVTVYMWGQDCRSAVHSGLPARPLDDPATPAQLATADVIVGTLRVSTYDTPPVVTADIVARMRPGSVIVDVTAGFGAGYIQTSDRLTSLDCPVRTVYGVTHIKIRELPLGVHQSAAAQISHVYAPYALRLVQSLASGVSDPVAERGKIVSRGQILNSTVERHYLSGFRE